ncbi:MAG: hypothetical protein EOO09_16160, partial [Chitinophagaceae bacterium]
MGFRPVERISGEPLTRVRAGRAGTLIFAKIPFIPAIDSILSSPIEYLKGVGPQRAELIRKELEIFSFRDLLEHFPFRHVDKTVVMPIATVNPGMDFVQVAGKLMSLELVGTKGGRRLL